MKTYSIHLIRIATLAVLMWGTCGVVSADDPAPSAGPALGSYAGRLPFFGTFPSDSHLTNGYISLKVTAKGSVSGSIAFAGYLYRMKDALVGGVLGPIVIPHPYGPSIHFAITASDDTKIEGTVHRDGQDPVAFEGGHALLPLPRYTAASPFPYQGLYTIGLDHVKSTWVEDEMYGIDEWDEDDYLGEMGYGLMKISKIGLATIRGRLPDGARYSSATRATAFGPDLFQVWVYGRSLRGLGSVVGYLQNLLDLMHPDAPVILGGEMRWYPDRFTHPERSWLVAAGSEYNPPAPGEQILDVLPGAAESALPEETGYMGATYGLGGTLTQENFWGPGADMDHSNLFATLGGAPAVTRPLTPYGVVMGPYSGVASVGPGPSTVAVNFTVKTGAFKAVFTHPGTLKKTIGYGAIIQHRGDFSTGWFEGTLPGFGYGVFVNKVRLPSGSFVSHPGWIHLYPSFDLESGMEL